MCNRCHVAAPLRAQTRTDLTSTVFQEFASEVASGESAETATLEFAIGSIRPDLKLAEVTGCIDKMKPHPILEFYAEEGAWNFTQSQLFVLFLAFVVLEKSGADLRTFVARLKIKPEIKAEILQDLAATIISIVRHGRAEAEAIARVRQSIVALSAQPGVPLIGASPIGDAPRLSASLLLAAVDRFRPRGSGHLERTCCMLDLAGGGPVSDQIFSGTVARFDLKGVEFDRCIFENVTWANCRFDHTTRFHECSFHGGGLLHSEGFGLADLGSLQLDREAKAWVDNAVIAAGKRAYTTDNLQSDIASVVSKFIGKSRLALKSVAKQHLTTGPISMSRYRKEIIDTLLGTVVEPHTISGTSEQGYHIREAAAESVRFFAGNNVLTGPLGEAFERLKRELRIR